MTGNVLIKLSNINFHANPFIDSLAVTRIITEGAESFNKRSSWMRMVLKTKAEIPAYIMLESPN